MRILYKEDGTVSVQEVTFGTFKNNALEQEDGNYMNTIVFQAVDDSLVVTIVKDEAEANEILAELIEKDYVNLSAYESVTAAMEDDDDEDDDRGNGVNVSFDDVF